MNSITKRWARGSLFFTLLVVLAAECVFLYYMISGYYNYAGVAIDDKFTIVRTQLGMYEGASSEEKALRMIRAVEEFDEKGRFEMMLVDAQGNIVLTSSGVLPLEQAPPEDVTVALRAGNEGYGKAMYTNENGEKVLAVTKMTPYMAQGVVAMRLVTSMKLVDKNVRNVVVISLLIVFLIVLGSIVSGVYFIRSIVLPLQKVEATASRIAQGHFDDRVVVVNNDEIGSLCKTINHMAKELSKSERLKNEFITSVSHELRTPLTSIKGWTETVGQIADPNDPSFKRGVSIIAGETDRLYDMVEELLDFSRLQNGIELKPELLDLAAEVEEAVLLAQQRAANMGIAMCFEPPELPVAVSADRNRVRQALVNVIDNAIKYSVASGTIKLEILQEGNNAFVSIVDEGQGIAPDDLENVKIKFFKGKGAVRGSGIGLAMVDEIMQAHGGGLEITSEKGKGTQVFLRFPLFVKSKQPKAGQTKPV